MFWADLRSYQRISCSYLSRLYCSKASAFIGEASAAATITSKGNTATSRLRGQDLCASNTCLKHQLSGFGRRAVQNLSCAWRSTRPDEYRSSGAELRGRMRRCTHAPARYRRHSPPRIHGSQQGNGFCSESRTTAADVRQEGECVDGGFVR